MKTICKAQNLLVITIIIFNLVNCKSKLESSKSKVNPLIKKFDIDKFNNANINGITTYKINDSTVIQLMENKDTYQEIIKHTNNPLKTAFTYHKKSLILKGGGKFFFNIPVGIFKEYDEDGNYLNEVNYDLTCKVIVDELINKVRKDLQIDLLNPIKNLTVNRNYNESSKEWEYIIRYPLDDINYRYITVSGNTGNVISDKTGYTIE